MTTKKDSSLVRKDSWVRDYGENASYFRIEPHSKVIPRGNFLQQNKLK